ncbi:MAG: succinylglutamate desuccinylase/aspartoacylase family protein [bacterium]|nr:succinylglutamate desuccinylase/aspartoacylase family protein [bacterium]
MLRGKHKLFTDISGNEVCVQSYSFGEGECSLLIQGGVHGGEITYYIFNELFSWLSSHEKELKKKITLIPIVNPVAWNQRTYYYTAGKFDLYKGLDWNRSYPGKDTSLSAINSKRIFSLSKNYEMVVDLHTARSSRPHVIYMSDKIRDLVIQLGFKFNYFIDINKEKNKKFSGTLTEAVTSDNRSSITIECGSHDLYNKDHIDEVTDKLLKLMQVLGIVEGNFENSLKAESYYFEKINLIYSDVSGFARYYVLPGEKFNKGDVLGDILVSSNLGEIVEFVASEEGVMFEIPRSNVVWCGDELFRVVYKNDLG